MHGNILAQPETLEGKLTVMQDFAYHKGFLYQEMPLKDEFIDKNTLKLLNLSFIVQNNILPCYHDKQKNLIVVAIGSKEAVWKLDDIRLLTGLNASFICAEPDNIREAIQYFYNQGDTLEIQNIIGHEYGDMEIVEEQEIVNKQEEEILKAAASDAPVIKLVNGIIADASAKRASDIHLEPREAGMLIRFRIDGELYEQPFKVPESIRAAVISRLKIMAKLKIDEKRRPQGGSFTLRLAGNKKVDFRLSFIPTTLGEKVVIRILDRAQAVMKLDDIGFDPQTLIKYRRIAHRRQGIVLVTGPTGSGKTTTLYATLSDFDIKKENIITIEDPPEYDIQGVNQMAVKNYLSFADGLREVLRQDPDIVMVGEIRDQETAKIAIQAALTGHLIFSTLHTSTALEAVTRLVDLGVNESTVTKVLSGVVAQRLVRKNCPYCIEDYRPSDDVLKLLSAADNDKLRNARFRRGAGCTQCGGTGFLGRTPLYEVLIMTDEIKDLILANKSYTEMKKVLKSRGHKSIWQEGLERVIGGIMTLEELTRVSAGEELE